MSYIEKNRIQGVHQKAKIIATVGPTSREKKILIELIKAGADVFRLNFSHGTHQDHQKTIDVVREINVELGTHIALLQDLQGPKIRVNQIENGGVEIAEGQALIITTDEILGTKEKVSTSYKLLANDVNVGDSILIDDGNLEVKVTSVQGEDVHTEVIYGGILKSRKGINLPNTVVSAPSLTEKDYADLEFGLGQNLDWVALSFVRKASDIIELRKMMEVGGGYTKIIAKVEKPEALENIDEIIAATDGVMIARGDLGVEIPGEQVPIWQKKIIEKCNQTGKPVIVATQMMESMVDNPRPTRAETNDVANAILDGTDAVMLSAESASGKYPIEAVRAMANTIANIEYAGNAFYNKTNDFDNSDNDYKLSDMLIKSACALVEDSESKAIVAMSKSGYSGYRVAMYRPNCSIFLVTNNRALLTQMNLVWGVKGLFYDKETSINDTLGDIEAILLEKNLMAKGDIYITTASMPKHWDGHANMIKIKKI
ncbi:MAG: pyruvate kinase [Flammeovirgaceae bacterium]|nr:pyruvate kinase [Flammeovirgaceae bacterium]